MQQTSRALVAAVSSLALLFVSTVPSELTARASAAVSAYGETYLTLSAFSGHAGPVVVSGGGFQPGTQVAVFAGDGAVPANAPKATVGAGNSFGPINVEIPVGSPQGAVTINAVGVGGLTNDLRATNTYYVTPFAASITVTAAAHMPGTPVVVAGSGFAPAEAVKLELGSASASATADATGAFTGASITVPKAKPDSYQLTGTGQGSGAKAVDYFYIDAFYPSASPSAYYLLPGQTLSFTGNGYQPGETVKVGEATGPAVSSLAVPANAKFESVGGFVIPLAWANTSRELHLVGVESGGTSVLTVSIGQFFPSVSPSAYYAMPGDAVSFTGAGFAGGETVDVFAGTAAVAAKTFVVDAGGAFANAGAYTVPYSAGASLNFRFVGRSTHAETSTGISIGALFPQIQPSEYFAHAGAPLTIKGTGFAKSETVNLTAPGITASGVADKFGAVTIGPLAIPFSATASLTLTAVGATSGGKSSVTITIGKYTPTASASTYYLLGGNPVVVSGTGFAPGEMIDVVQGAVAQDTAVLASTPADTAGAVIGAPIIVPFDAKGPITYGLRGQSSNALAEVTITAGEYSATVSSDGYYVKPGIPFHVTGGGFAPGETVTVKLGDTSVEATADTLGTTNAVELSLPFPKPAEKAFTVTLAGAKSKAKAETSITPAPYYANVSPSTWYDQSGKPVMFSGDGFASGETVAVSLNGTVTGSALVGSLGTFDLSGMTLPYGVGSANYSFVGALSGATASVSIGLAPYSPNVTPSTWYGKAGAKVSFTGDSFAPGETVTAKRGTTVIGTAIVDAAGGFTLDGGALPFAGPASYTFAGNLTAKNSTVEIGIAAFYPGLKLSSYYGPGGSDVVIEGSGFVPGEPVALTFGTSSVGNVDADSDGAFSKRTAAPFAAAGEVKVAAKGASSGATATTAFTYAKIYNSVELGAYAIAPGGTITFTGSGFLSNEPVQVLDRSTVVHTFNASATGTLNDSSFVLPASTPPGPLVLAIRGTHSFTERAITLYVTGG